MFKQIKTVAVLLGLYLFTSHASYAACLTSEVESNDSESTANSGICSGVRISGDMSRRDTDWFSFTTNDRAEIAISLIHHSRDDFDWALYRASGGALLTGETSTIPESGSYLGDADTYYLKVTRYKGSGWYDLTIDFSQADGGTPGGNDCGYGVRPALPAGLSQLISGSTDDQCATLTSGQGAALLMGGGSDVDDAFANRVKPHIGAGSDVVVLRASGTDAYNDYLQSLIAADSVETLIIDSRTLANSDYVDWVIRSAEFVFVAGGDQSEYLNLWQGTKVQTALQSVFDKGGVIGGTSAGMAIMAASVYDPDGVAGAVSSEVVTDFCHQTLNFSSSFVSLPMLANSLTDTHFYERDRMGRAVVSLGHHSTQHFAIAASEGTSLFVDSFGVGVVDGSYEVYVLRETAQTERVELSCGLPVIYKGIERIKLLSGDTIDLNDFSHSGEVLSIGIDGNNSQFYTPTDPY
ncbi:cyanophycinase [Corallincola platygyrae]|uniref:Cyanophycinase n=1 Tax=Corallincola platygyrae TaxID=1193278 RepID=A0ABW4XS01_9GAMM